MKTRFQNIEREFSPSEAEKITGVGVALQRDWRRRKILPENQSGKWTRFSLTDVITMSVMKTFSDAGGSVSFIADFAGMAILPTLSMIGEIPGSYSFEGDEISDELKEQVLRTSVVGAHGRYLLMVKSPEEESPRIARSESLEAINDLLADNEAIHCTVIDCWRLAAKIADRAGLPLFRVEVERVEDE